MPQPPQQFILLFQGILPPRGLEFQHRGPSGPVMDQIHLPFPVLQAGLQAVLLPQAGRQRQLVQHLCLVLL